MDILLRLARNRRWPSMKLAVKPHQAFSPAARTIHAAALRALASLPFLNILFPPPLSPHPMYPMWGERGGGK